MGCCKEEEVGFSNVADFIEHSGVLNDVEGWIRNTKNGRQWLEKMAADIGVPVQLELPLTTGGSQLG